MRKGWEYKKLNEVCEKGASNIVINKLTDNSGEYPLFGASGLVKNIDFFHQDKPYIGIVKDGAGVGRVNIYPAYSSLVGTMQYIFPKEGYSIDFIKYFLVKLDLSHCVSGATIPHIYFKDYGKENIPTPSLATQLAIVSELDKINELIRLKKEQLKDFDNLAQSLFYEMFGDPVENEMGWEVKKLGEIGEFKNGLNFSKDENGHSIKFLGVSDFQNKKSIASDQLAYISLSERVQEDYLLKTDDIVFVRSNGKKELIGRSVKMYITEPTTYSGFCIRCRITDEKVDKDYIAILLKTPIIRQFMTNSGRGCNISNLNQKVLNSIPTILPPLSLQRLFAQRIEQIEREKSEVQKSIQNLETLQASRMQYWFE